MGNGSGKLKAINEKSHILEAIFPVFPGKMAEAEYAAFALILFAKYYYFTSLTHNTSAYLLGCFYPRIKPVLALVRFAELVRIPAFFSAGWAGLYQLLQEF